MGAMYPTEWHRYPKLKHINKSHKSSKSIKNGHIGSINESSSGLAKVYTLIFKRYASWKVLEEIFRNKGYLWDMSNYFENTNSKTAEEADKAIEFGNNPHGNSFVTP